MMGYQDDRGRGRRDKGRQRCRLTRGANERAVVTERDGEDTVCLVAAAAIRFDWYRNPSVGDEKELTFLHTTSHEACPRGQGNNEVPKEFNK